MSAGQMLSATVSQTASLGLECTKLIETFVNLCPLGVPTRPALWNGYSEGP